MERSFRRKAETKWNVFRPDVVDGRLKHRYPIQRRVTGEAEGHSFVAAGGISLEAMPVQIVGTVLAGEHRLAATIPPHEHAIVVKRVLVQQAGVNETLNYLGGNASFVTGFPSKPSEAGSMGKGGARKRCELCPTGRSE